MRSKGELDSEAAANQQRPAGHFKSAITFEGVMIDAASVRIIRNMIAKADAIGM
jgi:hypothetical protein